MCTHEPNRREREQTGLESGGKTRSTDSITRVVLAISLVTIQIEGDQAAFAARERRESANRTESASWPLCGGNVDGSESTNRNNTM